MTSADIERARATRATTWDHDTVLIAAAFCMYNRYVDGLATMTPTDSHPMTRSVSRWLKRDIYRALRSTSESSYAAHHSASPIFRAFEADGPSYRDPRSRWTGSLTSSFAGPHTLSPGERGFDCNSRVVPDECSSTRTISGTIAAHHKQNDRSSTQCQVRFRAGRRPGPGRGASSRWRVRSPRAASTSPPMTSRALGLRVRPT